MDHPILHLNALTLPAQAPKRTPRVPLRFQRDGYQDGFDHDTLYYDAVRSKTGLSLIAPKLNNLRHFISTGRFWTESGVLKLKKIRPFRRHDEIYLSGTSVGESLQISFDGIEVSSQISECDFNHFAGLNVAIFMMCNDALDWVRNYIAYYQDQHALDALIIVNNGSTDYSDEDIQQMLSTSGLKRSAVIPAPFRYGPRGRKPYARAEKYLQTAILNIARTRLLALARAVLVCDIDELAHSPQESIFDAAVRSSLGFALWRGYWRYPEPGHTGFAPHQAHVFGQRPEVECSPKYCIVPGGPLRALRWDVHGVQRLPFQGFLKSSHGRIWHCRHVTTGWKSGRQLRLRDNLYKDVEAEQVFNEVFDAETKGHA